MNQLKYFYGYQNFLILGPKEDCLLAGLLIFKKKTGRLKSKLTFYKVPLDKVVDKQDLHKCSPEKKPADASSAAGSIQDFCHEF